jgi:acyl carrier protein
MIPSAFVTLPALPLTASGKVDRKALPEPSRNPVVVPGAEPQTDAEKDIALLFSELLKVQAVSVHDNFIELGGDSLAATQLLAGISGRFGVELPARLVFDSTLAELARELSAKSRTDLARRC